MHSILLIKAFEKAKEEIGSNKKIRIARRLSDIIYEDDKQQYGEKILIVNYNKIKNDPSHEIELRSFVIDALSRYLGYTDYIAFANENKNIIDPSGINNNPLITFFKKNRITIFVSTLLLIGFMVYYSLNKQRWMVWNENYYIEVKFDLEKYRIEKLKPYKEERIKYFKKINTDCNTAFFNSSGEVKIWYGKNSNKELEYFTDLGLHPETGKTLDPITIYMIRKYVCPDYGR